MAERARCELCGRDFPSNDALAMHSSAKHPMQEKPKTSNKKLFITVAVIAIIIILGYFLISGKSTAGNTINNPPGNDNPADNEIQKITLGFNGNYFPNTIKVKQGIPVEITLDNSVRGCFRTFVIRDLGVKKTSSSPSDVISFTPNKKGTFIYACGMHMGTGTIVVE